MRRITRRHPDFSGAIVALSRTGDHGAYCGRPLVLQGCECRPWPAGSRTTLCNSGVNFLSRTTDQSRRNFTATMLCVTGRTTCLRSRSNHVDLFITLRLRFSAKF